MERKISGIGPLFEDHTDAFIPAEKEPSKAEFARQFIRERPLGVTPDDLFNGFEEAHIPIAKAYVYSLLQRLRDQQVIRQRRGKWYPVAEEAPASGDNGAGILRVLP